MIGVKGLVQREGEVIHIIGERLEDLTPLLHSVGNMYFPHRPGRGDAATHPGSPDRGEEDARIPGKRVGDVIRVKSRDFH